MGERDAVWTQKSWLFVNKVDAPPPSAIESAIWHFGWGAEDMIGNAAEWTNEWFVGLGIQKTGENWPVASKWPGDGFNNDDLVNVTSSALTGPGSQNVTTGIPAAALRGGATGQGGDPTGPGIFAIALDRSPTNAEANLGFRCVKSRDESAANQH